MAAATLSMISLSSSDPQHYHLRTTLPLFAISPPVIPTNNSFLSLSNSRNHSLKSFLSSCHSSSSLSPSTTTSSSSSSDEDADPPITTDVTSPFLEDAFRTGRFLTNEELERLKSLENFVHFDELKSGFLWVRVMRTDEMDRTVSLLSESFAESMLLPVGYEKFLGFLVKQYLIERRTVMPHAVTLLGFYKGKNSEDEDEDEEVELAGTVEVCFDKRGANASPPTPTPPNNSPYICNMTVKKHLRRRGIGWRLLRASEELITQMTSSKEVYLHCRMIDAAPFNMYKRAGYYVVKTDSILILLMLQRRKHLMCKELPVSETLSKSDISVHDEELPT